MPLNEQWRLLMEADAENAVRNLKALAALAESEPEDDD